MSKACLLLRQAFVMLFKITTNSISVNHKKCLQSCVCFSADMDYPHLTNIISHEYVVNMENKYILSQYQIF